MSQQQPTFDPVRYKETTREQRISAALLGYATEAARAARLENVWTRELDGESLTDLEAESFDAAWAEIEVALDGFESNGRYSGPCELVVAVGTR